MNKDEMIKDSEHKETRFESMTHFDEPSIPHSFVIPSYDFGGDKVIRQRNAFFVKYEQAKKEMREILDKVDYESNGQTKQITDLLRKQYDIGVEYDRH